MPVDDGCREVLVGNDLRGQLVAHDFYQIAAREKISRIAIRQTLLGQEHRRNHYTSAM